MNFSGIQFIVNNPDFICTYIPPLYKVGLFNKEQAELFFSLDLDHARFKIFAINEDQMKIERVLNLQQAVEFYGL